jgi:hypothetical protein
LHFLLNRQRLGFEQLGIKNQQLGLQIH